mmetsp:Transcript_42313/g.106140  ORF Transcript_42313/g.106140 Transcript_42313/m.106140 type:complete len:245 (-) Transcript_42313:1821-2555(-)
MRACSCAISLCRLLAAATSADDTALTSSGSAGTSAPPAMGDGSRQPRLLLLAGELLRGGCGPATATAAPCESCQSISGASAERRFSLPSAGGETGCFRMAAAPPPPPLTPPPPYTPPLVAVVEGAALAGAARSVARDAAAPVLRIAAVLLDSARVGSPPCEHRSSRNSPPDRAGVGSTRLSSASPLRSSPPKTVAIMAVARERCWPAARRLVPTSEASGLPLLPLSSCCRWALASSRSALSLGL